MAFECQSSVSLSIAHVLSGATVEFKQIKMTGFSDTVTPNWNSEVVYGRMDPIVTYQNTTRAINLAFDLGPFTLSDDRRRLALAKISRLMQFQYPSYSSSGDALAISRPPLLRVSFMNYIKSGTGGGLLCYMDSMAYTPIDGQDSLSVPKVVDNQILPQRVAVSLSLNILHEGSFGWTDSGTSATWDGSHFGPSAVISSTDASQSTAGAEPEAQAQADAASTLEVSDRDKQINQLTSLGILDP